jgi:hypothetical protein
MRLDVLIGEVALLLIGGALWIDGYLAHKRAGAGSGEAIRLPRAVALLFGRPREDNPLSIRGMLTQALAVMLIVIYSLMNLNVITHSEAFVWTAWSLVGLLVLAVALSIVRRRQ